MADRIEDGGPAAGLVARASHSLYKLAHTEMNLPLQEWGDICNDLQAVINKAGLAAAEITRLRAENAGMLEALEGAEALYKNGILNTPNAEIDRCHALRRAAISRARQIGLSVGSAG